MNTDFEFPGKYSQKKTTGPLAFTVHERKFEESPKPVCGVHMTSAIVSYRV